LYYGELAFIEFNLGQWPAALKIAENGLSLHPEEINCRMARIRALDRLGRKAESKQDARDLLRIVPEHHYAHMNIGWSFLEHGDHIQAAEHFREALRIDPNMDLAQKGLIEALKCKFFGYRWLRRASVWMQTQRSKPLTIFTTIMWMFLFPILPPLMLLGLFGLPLSSAFLLRFNRYGRLILFGDKLLEANLNFAAVMIGFGNLIAFIVTHQAQWLLGFLSFFAAAILITIAFRAPPGWIRWCALAAPAGFVILVVVDQIRLCLLAHDPAAWARDGGDEVGAAYAGTYVLFMLAMVICGRIVRIVPRR
jgi:tetratricopeptide (TPR) repeat protein